MRIRTQSGPDMRIRSDSEGLGTHNLLNPRGRGVGGWIRGRLKKIVKSPTASKSSLSLSDEQQSPVDEINPIELPSFEQLLEERCFYEAKLLLTDRENQLLGNTTADDPLPNHDEEREKLKADRENLEKGIKDTLLHSLSLSREDEESVSALTSAVNAIYWEENQERLSSWKKLHDSILRSVVEERMDNPSLVPVTPAGQSSIQSDIQCIGRQMKEDLLFVVTELKDCYPPEANICQFFAALYHETLSARLRKIAEFVLDDKDCTFILRWVNEYYPGILKKPELAKDINSTALGKLLPSDLQESMEDQYLSTKENELCTYMTRVLDEEKNKWRDGEEPTKEDGCYISPLAYDIIQFINGMVSAAETVTGSQDKALSLTKQLTDPMQSFKVFHENVIKQDKKNSRAQVKANLSSIEQFREVLERKQHLFPDNVRETCLSLLADMKCSAHLYLLGSIHKTLKPLYQKLGTSEWLKKNPFVKLLQSIEQELQTLEGLTQSCHQEAIEQFHQEVAEEYVRKLLKGEVKLKDKEHQQRAYVTVEDNAKSLHKLLSSKGSRKLWIKDLLSSIAEVLKLQDVPALQMQIVSLGSAYPDFSEKHASALLKLKTNLSRCDRKSIKEALSDTLKETQTGFNSQTFFSKVEVK